MSPKRSTWAPASVCSGSAPPRLSTAASTAWAPRTQAGASGPGVGPTRCSCHVPSGSGRATPGRDHRRGSSPPRDHRRRSPPRDADSQAYAQRDHVVVFTELKRHEITAARGRGAASKGRRSRLRRGAARWRWHQSLQPGPCGRDHAASPCSRDLAAGTTQPGPRSRDHGAGVSTLLPRRRCHTPDLVVR